MIRSPKFSESIHGCAENIADEMDMGDNIRKLIKNLMSVAALIGAVFLGLRSQPRSGSGMGSSEEGEQRLHPSHGTFLAVFHLYHYGSAQATQ